MLETPFSWPLHIWQCIMFAYYTWLQVVSLPVSCEFASCKSASHSMQVACLQVACLWLIGRCAHFNVKLLHYILTVFSIFTPRLSGRRIIIEAVLCVCVCLCVCLSVVIMWHHGMMSLCHVMSPNDISRAKRLCNARCGRCVNAGAFSYSLKCPFYSRFLFYVTFYSQFMAFFSFYSCKNMLFPFYIPTHFSSFKAQIWSSYTLHFQKSLVYGFMFYICPPLFEYSSAKR